MILRLVLWNLADSKTTIHELRRYLRDESADAFADVKSIQEAMDGGKLRSTCVARKKRWFTSHTGSQTERGPVGRYSLVASL